MSAQQQTSKLAVIYAGEDFTVADLSGGAHVVRVRSMPARHLGRVLRLADHEAELLELVCLAHTKEGDETETTWKAVSAAWVDNLSDEAHEQLYEAAKRLNFSRAVKWAERQIAAKQFVADITLKADELLRPLMQQIVASVVSSLPQSASPAKVTPKS